MLQEADVEALRPEAVEAAHVDVADQRPAGHKRLQRRGGVRLHLLADARAAVAKAIGRQRFRRHHVTVLAGELIARHEVARELRVVGRQILFGVIQRVAREDLAARGRVVVDASLAEVLIERLVELEGVERGAIAEGAPVGARILREIRRHASVDADIEQPARARGIRQQPVPGIVVGAGGLIVRPRFSRSAS